MGKYKATINIDRELWDKFRDKCDELETTASEEIRRFISLFVLEEETKEFDTYDYNQFPNSLKKTYDKLEGRLSISFDQRFDFIGRKIEAIEKMFALKEIYNDCDQFVGYRRSDGEADKETDNSPSAIAPAKTDGEADKETDNSLSAIARSEKLYSDEEVAKIEGLSKPTINRYRRKAREPKNKSFWERWEIAEKMKKWRKRGGEEESQ